MSGERRAWPTRVLHALLAVAVVHQLLVSLAMEEPEEEGGPEGMLVRELGEELEREAEGG